MVGYFVKGNSSAAEVRGHAFKCQMDQRFDPHTIKSSGCQPPSSFHRNLLVQGYLMLLWFIYVSIIMPHSIMPILLLYQQLRGKDVLNSAVSKVRSEQSKQ